MAVPKWVSKLIRIIIIIFERTASQAKAIAELQARVEASEAALAKNAEGDAANAAADAEAKAALEARIVELQAAAAAEDDEINELFASIKEGDEPVEEVPAE